MKTYREILEAIPVRGAGEMKILSSQSDELKLGLQFIADQLVNDENSSDQEMVAHLTKELSGKYYAKAGFDKKTLSKIVKNVRPKVIISPLLPRADIYRMITREM